MKEPWTESQARRYRLLEAGQISEFAILIVIGTFLFIILFGIGGIGSSPNSPLARRFGLDAPRWASMCLGAGCCLLGLQSLRWSRRRFLAAGLRPDEVRVRIAGIWFVLGLVMIFLGGVGLLYVVSSIELTRAGPDIELEPVDHAGPLAIAFAIYVLAGVILAVRNLRVSVSKAAPPASP